MTAFAVIAPEDLEKMIRKAVREALGLSRDQNQRIDTWLPEQMKFAEMGEG